MQALLIGLLISWAIVLNAEAQQSEHHNFMTPLEVTDGTAKFAGHFDGTLRLAISLKIPHPQEEEHFLEELQDRSSQHFHRFLTPKEWDARFAPSAEDEQALVDWAAENGFKVVQRFSNRLLVDVEAPASIIEKAFRITINRYALNSEIDYSNDRDPTIPPSLASIIQSVEGLNDIQRVRPAHRAQPGR